MNNNKVEKKYLIIPGYVISKSDGERHFITGIKLINLYKVNPEECVIANEKYLEHLGLDRYYPELIPLRPRYDGDYKIK